MEFVICTHRELTRPQLEAIAALKDQHWPHGIPSQISWILANFEVDDVHIILYNEERALAYASLNAIVCTVDGREIPLWGLGGVCVDRKSQKQGLGKMLVDRAVAWLDTAPGLLLCHRELTGFYGRCGWETVNFAAATVAGKPFDHCIMSLNQSFGDGIAFHIPKNF